MTHTMTASTPEMVGQVYARLKERVSAYKESIRRPLSLTEKILAGHLEDGTLEAGQYIGLRPDRVALQDVTGQMVMLQFMTTGLGRARIPTTIHCDHLIRAKVEGGEDMRVSLGENDEVFRFLESSAQKYGCGFWRPGAGIIHQVVLENYAFPGGLMIGTDSHTPNAGGLGMMAVGVGGIDAAQSMAGLPWEVLYPRRIGVHLTGRLSGWGAPKDVILKVASELTVSGGTNAVLEYFGPGAESISCTGKATITNMGAEIGATCSVFQYDSKMASYLRATRRGAIADLADKNISLLRADPEIEQDMHRYFDRIIEIDLARLEPHVVGPHTPDLARPVSNLAKDAKREGYVDEISVALVGSCTNSSYEDMSRAADVARQAASRGVRAQIPLLVTPGSEQIRATIERDGQMGSLIDIGATVLANACGPCIGQWSRPELKAGRQNTILTSFNRNFPGRNDGNRQTMNFIASPELVVAMALGGRLSFNPLKDELKDSAGNAFILAEPQAAPEVPPAGFAEAREAFVPPPKESGDVDVKIDSSSSRIQRLEPFDEWDGRDYTGLHIMAKVSGKCTTDHISPAGAWLSYRGHLENLSDNMLLGAVSAFGGKVGEGKNALSGKAESYAQIARQYKKAGLRWVIIGDSNYGEGSSREHAAMTPRYLGCAAVIARGFARIHETNLKKQGVLALRFSDAADYDKILEDDRIGLIDLKDLAPDRKVRCIIDHGDRTEEILLNHSYSEAQLEWFRRGSALNTIKS